MGYQSLCAPPLLQHHALLSPPRSYATGPISVRSTCAHHFQNIVGKCWVGVVPETEVSTGTLHYHSHSVKCACGGWLPSLSHRRAGHRSVQVQPHRAPHLRAPTDSGGNDFPNCGCASRDSEDTSHVSEFLGSCVCSSRCNPTHFYPCLSLYPQSRCCEGRTPLHDAGADSNRLHLLQAATLTRVSCSGV